MPAMTDPMAAFKSLQQAIDSRLVAFQRCKVHHDLQVLLDEPAPGKTRFTYAKISNGKVMAIAMFALTDPVSGVLCFQLGYAVRESTRNSGLGAAIVKESIEEISSGFKATPLQRFYVEAVVGVSNIPSNKIAAKILSSAPTECTDVLSGEPALQYLRLIE
jgi:hypothetical protein